MVDRDIRFFVEMVHSFDDVHNLFTLLSNEAIVICGITSNMNSKFLHILAGWYRFCHSNYVFELNHSLN